MVLQELQKMSAKEATNHQGEPPTKQLRKDQASSSLDQMFAKIADEHISPSMRSSIADSIHMETFIGENTISRTDSPFRYWAVNEVRFPTVAQMSQKYLSAPL